MFVANQPSKIARLPLTPRVFLAALAGVAIYACDRTPSAPAGTGTGSQMKSGVPSRASASAPAPAVAQGAIQDVLGWQGGSTTLQESVPSDAQVPHDPFKAVLEESNRQRAAAAASPFGTSK